MALSNGLVTIPKQLLLDIAEEAAKGTPLDPSSIFESWFADAYAHLSDKERRSQEDISLGHLPDYARHVVAVISKVAAAWPEDAGLRSQVLGSQSTPL